MAPKSTLLSSVLGDIPKDKGFLVRIIRLWIVPLRYNQNRIRSVELLLQDTERNRIQATVEPDLWDQFKDEIEEHGLYAMKNFRVEANDVLFKPAPHPFRLYFKQGTRVGPFSLDKFQYFPRDIYKCKTVDEIFNMPDANNNDLIDFVGVLGPIEKLRLVEATTRASKHVTLLLLDSGMRAIYCTLWERYAEEAMAKIHENRDVHVVVLIQLCRIKRDDSISLSTSFHVTKVIVDEYLPEIEDFRIHFMAAFQASSQNSGQISGSSGNVGNFGPVETIKNLRDAKETRGYWFYGQITRVISRDNWSYPSCPNVKCAKKVKRVEDGYVCDN